MAVYVKYIGKYNDLDKNVVYEVEKTFYDPIMQHDFYKLKGIDDEFFSDAFEVVSGTPVENPSKN